MSLISFDGAVECKIPRISFDASLVTTNPKDISQINEPNTNCEMNKLELKKTK